MTIFEYEASKGRSSFWAVVTKPEASPSSSIEHVICRGRVVSHGTN